MATFMARVFLFLLHLHKPDAVVLPDDHVSMRKSFNFGFLLIELAIVFAILGTLAAIAIPNYLKYKSKAQMALVVTEIRVLEKEIENYAAEHGNYPGSLDDIGMGHIKDPWGNPYQYLKIDGEDLKGGGKDKKMRKDHFMVPVNSDFDLYSMGPDGDSQAPFTAKASRDDIVRANDGEYVGLASEY
jgi:general secretion pathway protein G